jgi:hypothetical protein
MSKFFDSKNLAQLTKYLFSLQPKASVRIQLLAASSMWLTGASILLVRGAGYIYDRHWHAWALGAGLAVGVIKSCPILDRLARKAFKRIYQRKKAAFFGFFSAKSWTFVVVMMGTGIVLRRIVVHPDIIVAGIMGAIYVGVGTALLITDRIFWYAVFAGRGEVEK